MAERGLHVEDNHICHFSHMFVSGGFVSETLIIQSMCVFVFVNVCIEIILNIIVNTCLTCSKEYYVTVYSVYYDCYILISVPSS